MNTTADADALRQGIALLHFEELIPETRVLYATNLAKMTAYTQAFPRITTQLREQQQMPTLTTLSKNALKLQALTALNHSLMATQMMINQEEALRTSTPNMNMGVRTINVHAPRYPAMATQQIALRAPTLVRTES
jgi:hypothetical protein